MALRHRAPARRVALRRGRALAGALGLAALALLSDGSARAQLENTAPTRADLDPHPAAVGRDCTLGGVRLQGRVRVVDAFPDLRVQVVDAFPDLKVKWVDAFADECGRWQAVDAFPDLTIQYVDSFPDLRIKVVDAFPGLP
ncbi:MAG: hypothetical protein R3A79_06415 [Nannocystaceae bacterium]